MSRQAVLRPRILLILGMIALIAGCAWVVFRPHRDDAAVKIIQSAGGKVTRESRIPFVALCLDANIFPYGATFDVECRSIYIDRQLVEAVSSLPDLYTWYCSDCIFEPDSLKSLQPMAKLRMLSLIDTKIGDNDLVYLRSLENLELLSLTNANVTDEGIVRLAALKSLRVVNLGGTKVTAAGRDRLKSLLPNVVIRD